MVIRSFWGSALALLAACKSSTTTTNADAPGSGSAVAETGMLLAGSDQSPIVGGQVCLLHSSLACATTDATGEWELDVPSVDGPTITTYSPDVDGGYLPKAFLGYIDDGDVSWASTVYLDTTDAAATVLGTGAGFAYPSGSGGFLEVRVSVNGENGSGATVAISPAAGAGPVYSDATGTFMPSLASTAPLGEVAFGNLPAGTYDITASAGGGSCSVGSDSSVVAGDWPPTTAGTTTRAEVVDGMLTANVNIFCTE
jgi:hypothetical protein